MHVNAAEPLPTGPPYAIFEFPKRAEVMEHHL